MTLKLFEKGANIQISPHFNSNEFDCQCRHKDCNYTLISIAHVEYLEKKRVSAQRPFKITSGFRCQKHNADVGGAVNSQHLRGVATDIQVSGISAFEASKIFGDADGLGIYPNFVHVDSRGIAARWSGK